MRTLSRSTLRGRRKKQEKAKGTGKRSWKRKSLEEVALTSKAPTEEDEIAPEPWRAQWRRCGSGDCGR